MEVSFCTAPGNFNTKNGYGTASFNIIKSLQALGIDVPYDNPDSGVQLNFCQPGWMNLRDNQHSIAYTPWESTKFLEGWIEIFRQADEVWTTSNWCKGVFENNGLKDVKVYHHGIEDIWKVPQKRLRSPVLRFLNVGGPATRKGAQICLDAFLAAFKTQSDVHLTLKCVGHNEARVKDRQGNIIAPITELDNVTVDTRELSTENLVQLYLDHDVLIYPSMGEGFGLIPLQGLATGMPVVVTEAWCDYKNYVMPLESKLGPTQWPSMHPGKIYYPDFDNLVYWYRHVYDNFMVESDIAFNQTEELYKEFDWISLTANAFKNVLSLPKKKIETLTLEV